MKHSHSILFTAYQHLKGMPWNALLKSEQTCNKSGSQWNISIACHLGTIAFRFAELQNWNNVLFRERETWILHSFMPFSPFQPLSNSMSWKGRAPVQQKVNRSIYRHQRCLDTSCCFQSNRHGSSFISPLVQRLQKSHSTQLCSKKRGFITANPRYYYSTSEEGFKD